MEKPMTVIVTRDKNAVGEKQQQSVINGNNRAATVWNFALNTNWAVGHQVGDVGSRVIFSRPPRRCEPQALHHPNQCLLPVPSPQ